MEYNGWTNYPTWCVALWLDNDEGAQHDAYAIVEGASSTYDAADSLRRYVEELSELIAPAVYEASHVADLFGWAIGEVDWQEVAEHYQDDGLELDAETGAVSAYAIAILALVAGFAYLAAHVVAYAMRAMDAVGGGISG